MRMLPTHMGVCINSLSSCCSGNISSKYGIVGLKIAPSSSLCRPSISSCLIQKTLVFITHTCSARDTEPTVGLNKHTAVTLFHCQFAFHPVSKHANQINPSSQRGRHWHRLRLSYNLRPGGKRGAIIVAGCGVMTSAPKTASMATSCHVLDTCSWIIYSFTDVAEPADISYSFHVGSWG